MTKIQNLLVNFFHVAPGIGLIRMVRPVCAIFQDMNENYREVNKQGDLINLIQFSYGNNTMGTKSIGEEKIG